MENRLSSFPSEDNRSGCQRTTKHEYKYCHICAVACLGCCILLLICCSGIMILILSRIIYTGISVIAIITVVSGISVIAAVTIIFTLCCYTQFCGCILCCILIIAYGNNFDLISLTGFKTSIVYPVASAGIYVTYSFPFT